MNFENNGAENDNMAGGDNRICYCRTCQGVIHVIEEGDTLYALSRGYGVNLEDILYANPDVNVYNLQPGDRICIPFASLD